MIDFIDNDQFDRLLKMVNLNIIESRKLEMDVVHGGIMHICHDESFIHEDDEYKTFHVAFNSPYPGINVFRDMLYDNHEFVMRSSIREALNDMVKLNLTDGDGFISDEDAESVIEASRLGAYIFTLTFNIRLYEENIRNTTFSTFADYAVDESAFYLAPGVARLLSHLVDDEKLYRPFETELWMKLIEITKKIYEIGVKNEVYYADYEVMVILILILFGYIDGTVDIHQVTYNVTEYNEDDGFTITNIQEPIARKSSYYDSDGNVVSTKFDDDAYELFKKMKGIN